MGDLATVDINTAISTKGNLGTGGLAAFGLLVADGRDALQVFCQLDLQLTLIRAVDADVAFCQVALRTADDIESVVQLLGNFFSIITLELQAIIKSCRFVFGSFWIIYTMRVMVSPSLPLRPGVPAVVKMSVMPSLPFSPI